MDWRPTLPGAFDAWPGPEHSKQTSRTDSIGLRPVSDVDNSPLIINTVNDKQRSLPRAPAKYSVKALSGPDQWPALFSRPIRSTFSAAKSIIRWVQQGGSNDHSYDVTAADESCNVVSSSIVQFDYSKSKKRKLANTYTSRIPLAAGRKVPRLDQPRHLSREENVIQVNPKTPLLRTSQSILHLSKSSTHCHGHVEPGKLSLKEHGYSYAQDGSQRTRDALKWSAERRRFTRDLTKERGLALALQSHLRSPDNVHSAAIRQGVRSGNAHPAARNKAARLYREDFSHWMPTRSHGGKHKSLADRPGTDRHQTVVRLPSHQRSAAKSFMTESIPDVLLRHFSTDEKDEAQSKSVFHSRSVRGLPRTLTNELSTPPSTTSVVSPCSSHQSIDVDLVRVGHDALIASTLNHRTLSVGSRFSDLVCSSPTRETSVPLLQHEHTTSLSSRDFSTSLESGGVLLPKQELSDPVTIAGDLLLELEISGAGEKQHELWREETNARLAREAAEKARIEAHEQELLAKQRLEACQARLGRRIPKQPFIHRLTHEWDDRVDVASKKPSMAIVAKTSSGTELRRRDLMTVLAQTTWLNDEIINAYIDTIVDHVNARSGRGGANDVPKIIAHNSFFYKNIAEKGPNSVARWMKRKKAEGKKLLEVETILIPVNSNSHWTLIVVSPKTKTIEYLDSFGGNPHNYIENVRMWLRATLQDDWNEDEWVTVDTSVCQQHNGYDCGVFLLTNAECVAFGHTTDSYAATDMAAQRRRIGAILLNGGFL